MKRIVTAFALVLLALPVSVQAQTVVNLKQAFDVPQDSLDKAAANIGTLEPADLSRLFRSPFAGQSIQFTAVILSDPLLSGRASANNGAAPGRAHVYMRDTSAVTSAGVLRAGYTAQMVDGNYATSGLTNLAPGAVVTVTGQIDYFGLAPQISPTTITLVAQDLTDIGLSETLLDPISINIGDIAIPGVEDPAANAAQSAINAANFNLYAQEYVRVEGLKVDGVASFSADERFNVTFTNSDASLALDLSDVSLNYRNDRNTNEGYINAGFTVTPDSVFTPPQIGATVNVQGFLEAVGDFTNRYNPDYKLAINPFEFGDLEVIPGALPPNIASVTAERFSKGDADLGVSATVTASVGDGRSVSSVEVFYASTQNGTTGDTTSVPLLAGSNDNFAGNIPAGALADDSYLVYYVVATDSEGDTTTSGDFLTYARSSAISSISQARGIVANSPIAGAVSFTTDLFDITAVVMSRPDTSNIVTIQDDPTLAAGTGIAVRTQANTETLMRGDQITITSAQLSEFNGLTQLQSLEFAAPTQVTPYDYKTVTTTVLQEPSIAEAHESMLLRFEDVTVVSANPDGDRNFGEFAFATTGDSDGIRGDDASAAFPQSFNTTLTAGDVFSSIQGVFTFSFGNYKLLPEVESDVATATAIGDAIDALGFGLDAAFPNPTNGGASLHFSLERSADASVVVYDLMGRTVATLVEGARPAGSQTVSFDASNLASGLYLVRLTSEGRTATTQLVVTR